MSAKLPDQTFVSVAEMEEQCTGLSLLPWVLAKIESIAAQPSGTYALRHHEGGCKELVDELLPLAQWASCLKEPDSVLVQPVIGSQNYDAVVRIGSEEPIHIEVTQAQMQSDYLRIRHLEEKGWAPGPLIGMTSKGTKKTNLIVYPGRVAESQESLIRTSLRLINKAVSKKVKKNYPDRTRLIVAFEDHTIYDAAGIQTRLLDEVNSVVGEGCPFTHIYLIGKSQRLSVTWSSSLC